MQNIYRLGLDLGSSSIGWAIVAFNNISTDINNPYYEYSKIIAFGSRIFSDGRTASKTGGLGESLAAARRNARQARRQIDRKRGRRMAVFYALQKMGLMPKNTEQAKKLQHKNPYKLRNDGVTQRLNLFELGRALFHLQQRRGFKSSRKDLQKEDAASNETGSVKKTIAQIKQQMQTQGCNTVGQLLWYRYEQGDTTLCKKKFAIKKDGSENTDKIDSYENYFARDMIVHEFNTLWDMQAQYYPSILTDENKAYLRTAIFFQRPLKTPAVGHCTYIKDEPRAALCLPSTELYRLWQDMNNMVIKHKNKADNIDKDVINLGVEHKTYIIEQLLTNPDALNAKNSISYTALLGCLFKEKWPYLKSKDYVCNLDTTKSANIQGAATIMQLKTILGEAICNNLLVNNIQRLDKLVGLIQQDKRILNTEQQKYLSNNNIHNRLDNDDVEAFFSKIICEEYADLNLTTEQLNALNHIKLKDDYASLSSKAMIEMLKHMQAGATQYDAKVACEFTDAHYNQPNALAELPYYAEIISQYCVPQQHLFDMLNNPNKLLHTNHAQEIYLGKISNPSVHIALNEVRKVVNTLLKQYAKCFQHNNGKPNSIHIELARDLCMGQESLDSLIKQQNTNEQRNDVLKQDLLNLGIQATSANLEKYFLYNELIENSIKYKKEPCCIYSAKPLPTEKTSFYTEWNDWEIDHILPRSLTFDDSKANKILVSRTANRDKLNATPWQWIQTQGTEAIAAFKQRVENLPENKRWRCLQEGVDYINNPEKQPQARLLNDTRYMAKVARMYLQCLYDEKDESGKSIRDQRVHAVPSGKITAHIRNEWSFNHVLWNAEQQEVRQNINIEITRLQDMPEQDRTNIDNKRLQLLHELKSIPIDKTLWTYLDACMHSLNALSDKELKAADEAYKNAKKKLKNRSDNRHHGIDAIALCFADASLIQRKSTQAKNKTDKRLLPTCPNTLHDDIKQKLAHVVVSHKPDHATQSRLHEETARFAAVNAKKERIFTYNKTQFIENGTIQDPVSEDSVIGIKNKQGQVYKYYSKGSNYCYEIYKNAKGKYEGELISTYIANQKEYQLFMQDKARFNKQTFSGNALIMRLVAGDMLKVTDEQSKDKIVFIQKMTKGSLCFNEHFESNCAARAGAKVVGNALVMQTASPATLITKWKAKKVLVNPIGKVIVIDSLP
jgi:CRISPR-associated endonuclease Csn1